MGRDRSLCACPGSQVPHGPLARHPLGWLGSYRKEPLHSPVLSVGVSLCQGATVNGVAVEGVIKTCHKRREMGSRSSSTPLEVSVTRQAIWVLLSPAYCGFGRMTALCSPGGWWEALCQQGGKSCCYLCFAECCASWVSQPAVNCQGLHSGNLHGTAKPRLGGHLSSQGFHPPLTY